MCVMLSKFTKTNFKPKKKSQQKEEGGGCAGPESAFIYDMKLSRREHYPSKGKLRTNSCYTE